MKIYTYISKVYTESKRSYQLEKKPEINESQRTENRLEISHLVKIQQNRREKSGKTTSEQGRN